MMAASLFIVFLLARLAVVSQRDIPLSPSALVALVWQDVAFVLLFAIADRLLLARCRLSALAYAVLAAYAIANVPIARAISTPLTWPMLRAVDGTLADSIAHYATWENVWVIALLAAAAIVLPGWLRRIPRQIGVAAVPAALLIVALGPSATARVETWGLERNVVAALVGTVWPRLRVGQSEQPHVDWRRPPLDPPAVDDSNHLAGLRGTAAGRNVLLVVLESAAAQYLRPYGAAEDPMPNLTRLAGEGLMFQNAYVVYPESIKGLFALLCSRYPAFDTSAESYAAVSTPSLADVLAESGYQTALFHSGRFRYLGMEEVICNRGFETLEDAGHIGGNHESSFGVDEAGTVRHILAWIDARQPDRPFFVTYLPVAGHHPYETPEPGPFPTHDEIGRYRNALHYADRALGSLLDGLHRRGLDRQTLIVVCGDHGQAFGQHDGNYGHTLFLYEENVRIPLVMAAPGQWQATRLAHAASTIDLAPTVLDVLALDPPAGYQGSSLLAHRGGMSLFFTDYSVGLVGLRDGRWKYIHRLESGHSLLFDLATDPHERRDLAPSFPTRVQSYRDRLLGWAAAQRAMLARD